MKRTVIIHTTHVTIPLVTRLIRDIIPAEELEIFNLLDDSLLPELNSADSNYESVRFRVYQMLTSAALLRPAAVMSACSSIGTIIQAGSSLVPCPVLRIDEPMLDYAARSGGKIGIAATLSSTLQPTAELLWKKGRLLGRNLHIEERVIPEVNSLLGEGRTEEYDTLVGTAVREMLDRNEYVLLAQASMARAAAAFEPALRKRLLSSPKTGVEALCKTIRKNTHDRP